MHQRHAQEAHCCHAQEEFDTYRSTAEAVAEEKDAELARALKGNAQLREQLQHAQAQAQASEVCTCWSLPG